MGPISTRVNAPSLKIQMSAWLIMKAQIAAIPIVQMGTMLHVDKHALSMRSFCKLSIARGKSNWESNFGMARPLLVPAGVAVLIANRTASSMDALTKRRMKRRQSQQVSTRHHQSKPR